MTLLQQNKPVISVAPMMDWTDRHCRYFHRLIAPSVTLYTEMITTQALKYGDVGRHLRYNPAEHPVILQLGGSNSEDLAMASRLAEDYGYNEINLNCGCPSDRVQNGFFGACLMSVPSLVASCIKSMQDAVSPSLPVTVKCRIGIDDSEDYVFLENFVRTVWNEGGCQKFILHARKAWLQGLSPKENREIPPLQYDIVEKLKDNFPELLIEVNGGIKTIEQVKDFIATYDGVMIGREAYQNPWFLRMVEEDIYGTHHLLSDKDVVLAMIPYMEKEQAEHGTPPKSITRHMTGLFQGQPGARLWRQILSTEFHQLDAKPSHLVQALERAFG